MKPSTRRTWKSLAELKSAVRAYCVGEIDERLGRLIWSGKPLSLVRVEHGPRHVDDPDEYLRMSPITYVRDIATPMLIVHSEDDLRCPISQAEELFVALKLLGKEVEFVRFPAEGHELSRSGSPVHRVQRAELILEFFRTHLA